MFDWVQKIFKRKVVDARAFMGVDWPGAHVDAYRRVPKPNKEKLIDEYKGFAYICSNYNARIVFSTPLKLYRKLDQNEKCRWKTKNLSLKQQQYIEKANRINLGTGERIEEVVNHPALQLLKHPNPQMSGLKFLEFNQLYQEMVGESAWRIIYGPMRIPLQIYMLQPQYLKAEEDPQTGFVSHYWYGGKNPMRLELDEVIMFQLPNLKNPYLAGHAPLLGVYEDANILDLYKATEAAILNNEGRPDVLVSAKDGIGDVERFEKKFITKFRRGGKAGVMFAEDDVTVTPLSWSPKDLAFVQVGEQAKEMIALAYDIPPALLSSEGATQYNVDNTLANRHIINAINPRLERNTDVLNHHYLPLFDDSGLLFFAYDDPSVVNKEQQLETDCKLVAANVLTPNEIRISRGYEPTTWGELPAGMYNATTGAATSDSADPDTANDSSNEAAGAGEIQASGLNGAQIEGLLQLVEAITNGQLTPEAGKILIGEAFPLFDQGKVDVLVAEMKKAKPIAAPASPMAIEAPGLPPGGSKSKTRVIAPHCCCKAHKGQQRPKGEKELKEVLQKFFAKQKKEVLRSLKSKSKGLPSKFVPLKSWNKELYQQSQPLIEIAAHHAYGQEAQNLVGRAGISADIFNVKNPHLSKKIDSLALSFCEETNRATSEELNKALADLRESFDESMGEGERFNQLVERVEGVFDRADSERAELIASTESSRAYAQGQKQSAIDSGVVSGFKLLPASECCELCQSIADSGVIGLDENFHTDKEAPEAYQEKDTPPIHPHCFCTMESVIEGVNEGGNEEG